MTIDLANSVYTPQAGQNAKAGDGGVPAGLQGKGVLALSGASFMDLLFGGMTVPGEGQTDLSGTLDFTGQTDPLSGGSVAATGSFSTADALAALKQALGNANVKNADIKKALSADEQTKLIDYLRHLLAGTPGSNADDISLNGGEISLMSDGKATGSSPALIATSLTPTSLNEFMEKLSKTVEGGEAMIVGLVKILPPQAQKEMIFLPRGVVISPQQSAAGGDPSLEAQLNNLIGGNGEGFEVNLGEFDPMQGLSEKDTGFARVLRALESAQQKADGKSVPGLDKAIETIKTLSAGLSTVPGQAPLPESMGFDSTLYNQIFPDGMDWTSNSQGAGHPLSLNGPAMMTSLVQHAAQAHQPHPATQLVAAQITKAVDSGGNKNFTVRLDPPDLGRVEIRMEFGKDKSLKAHLLVEKPETYMMLQRDSQVLQKSLHEMGIQADGSALSFELAQDGHMFDHGSDQGGARHGAGGGSGGPGDSDGGIEIIESTMDLYFDPETGLTRYNILA